MLAFGCRRAGKVRD